jgi:hypothetical protein
MRRWQPSLDSRCVAALDRAADPVKRARAGVEGKIGERSLRPRVQIRINSVDGGTCFTKLVTKAHLSLGARDWLSGVARLGSVARSVLLEVPLCARLEALEPLYLVDEPAGTRASIAAAASARIS